MKLAFFSSIATDGNPTSGFEIANEALVAGLRELGHTVVEFGFKLPRQNQAAQNHQQILDVVNVENVSASTREKIKWIVKAHIEGLPVAAAKLPAFHKGQLANALSKEGPFDGAVVNSYQMAAAFPEILDLPYIYVAHNVEFRSAQENASKSNSAVERYLYRRDSNVLKKLEARLCANARFVWTFSDADLSDHKIDEGRGSLLPLVAPKVEPAGLGIKKKFDVGLIGTWSWQPNLVGLRWFLDEVVPKLPSELKIGVAGNLAAGFQNPHNHVSLLGRVESAQDFLNSVSLVPLISRGGTGVQLKTIETLQAGRTCVATSSSLRGIDTLPPNCIRADDAQSFCTAVTDLLQKAGQGHFDEVDGSAFYGRQKSQMLSGLVNGILHLV